MKSASSGEWNKIEINITVSERKNVGFKQEMEARSDVERMEMELEAAREKLAMLRKARYR